MLRFSVSIHRLPSSDSKFLRLALTCLESKDWGSTELYLRKKVTPSINRLLLMPAFLS